MQTSPYFSAFDSIRFVPTIFKNTIDGVGLLSNKIVTFFPHLGRAMQRNPTFAGSVFSTANLAIFIPLGHFVGSLLNNRIQNRPEELNSDELKLTKALVCFSTGAVVYFSNTLFAKLTKYPTNNLVFLALAIAVCISRAIFIFKKDSSSKVVTTNPGEQPISPPIQTTPPINTPPLNSNVPNNTLANDTILPPNESNTISFDEEAS